MQDRVKKFQINIGVSDDFVDEYGLNEDSFLVAVFEDGCIRVREADTTDIEDSESNEGDESCVGCIHHCEKRDICLLGI